jgi:hypothetical protein
VAVKAPWLMALALCLVGPAWAQAPEEPAVTAAPTLPEDPAVDEAKTSYNAGRYNHASRQFLVLAQRWPESPAIYRALARARNQAQDPEGAIVAYRFYLQLAARAPDAEKISAEMELLVKRVEHAPPAGAPPRAAKILSAAPVRAKSGKFSGPDGAFAAIADALQAGYIGPALSEVRKAVDEELVRRSRDALDRWWRPNATTRRATLVDMAAAWAARGAAEPAPAEARTLGPGLDGLAKLSAGDFVGAVERLAPVTGDPRLRAAQAMALSRANRHEEALAVLDALRKVHDDPRVGMLHALVLKRAGQEGANAALREALDL